MTRLVGALIFLVGITAAADVAGQGGDGSLRGTIKDEQGAAMPGVTVTLTGPGLLAPSTAVSDTDGTYRLINLPPGTYTLAAELTGLLAERATTG